MVTVGRVAILWRIGEAIEIAVVVKSASTFEVV